MVFSVTSFDVLPVNEDLDKEYIWKQLLISFLASIPFFTHGVETTSLAASAHSGHFITSTDDARWNITALVVGAGLSAPIYAYLIDRFGRRIGYFSVSLMQGASCIPLFLAPSDPHEILLHLLAGISSGGIFTVIPIYVREISNDRIRALAMSLMIVMMSAGYMMKLVMTEEVMMYLMVALIACQLLLVVVLLETPSYLVKSGKFEEAKINIISLKCVPKDSSIVTTELQKLKEEKERATANGKLHLINILRNTIYRDATKIGIVLQTAIVLCGSIIFLDQDKTLLQLKMDKDPQKALIVISMFSGSLFAAAVIRFVEKKYLLTFAFTVMTFSMGVLAIYTQHDLTVATYRMVPVVTLGLTVFGYSVAWALPIIIMAEILNFEIRATIMGVVFLYSQVLKLIHVHTLEFIEENMGIYSLLYVFVGVNIFGGVYTLFAVPDLKDKNVKQIERQLKRIPLLKFTHSGK